MKITTHERRADQSPGSSFNRILVAGGDGFIGSHVVDRLVVAGHRVRVLEPYRCEGVRNLNLYEEEIEWMAGDVDASDVVEAACEGCDLAYYFVSTTNPAETWNTPAKEVNEGIRRPVDFLERAAQAGIKKVVIPSSGGTVYGRQCGMLKEDTPLAPFSPHGIAKCAIEHFAGYFRDRMGLQVDIYRISNPYGPRQPRHGKQGVMAVWISQILKGETVHVYGDRTVRRDYVFVEDVARLMMHSLEDLDTSGTWNIGSGKGTSILDLLEVFKKSISQPFSYIIESRRAFDNISAVLDNTKLLTYFPGFRFISLQEGLSRTWSWFTEAASKSHGSL